MRTKAMLAVLTILVLSAVGYLLVSHMLYLNHTAVVYDTVAEVIDRNYGALPQQAADLAALAVEPSVAGAKIMNWRAETVQLKNAYPLGQSLADDDPVYAVKADLRVTYDDGREALLRWESWRYGVVLGPIVLSTGDGPPGRIVLVDFAE